MSLLRGFGQDEQLLIYNKKTEKLNKRSQALAPNFASIY